MTTTLTTPCPTCRDVRWVYRWGEWSTGYHPCPACQPAPQPLPEWITPMGYDERIVGEGGEFILTEQ
jgi:hypothetical protein